MDRTYFWEETVMANISRLVLHMALATLVICIISVSSNAAIIDLTVFGGIQHSGKLTFESAPGDASNLVQNFDPQTFGVFGARVGHGKLLGGEHTIAYAPNFIDSHNDAFLYHSNFRVQPSIAFVKPYATAGIGLIHCGGESLASFGTKFAFNYGGGVTLTAGPVGVNLDVRGYAVPKVSIVGFTTQQRLDFVQTSAGVVFRF
jgi:hypothetical protein